MGLNVSKDLGRVRLDLHSLNARGGGGTNYVEISKARVCLKSKDRWRVVEVPVISGNMVKHWHFVSFVDFFRKTEFGDNLTKRAIRYNAARFTDSSEVKANGENVNLDNERSIITNFADADVHGFLVPKSGIRRVSLVKTSFILPTEDLLESIDDRIIYPMKHNRVDVDESGKVSSGAETAMMVFNREYATGVYGFSLVLDLGMVGIPQCQPWNNKNEPNVVIKDEERKERISSALKALIPLLSGNLGANLSRAYPVMKLEEFIAIKSDGPLPALVHGFYKDYVSESERMLKEAGRFFEFEAYHSPGVDFLSEESEEVSSISELVSRLIEPGEAD